MNVLWPQLASLALTLVAILAFACVAILLDDRDVIAAALTTMLGASALRGATEFARIAAWNARGAA